MGTSECKKYEDSSVVRALELGMKTTARLELTKGILDTSEEPTNGVTKMFNPSAKTKRAYSWLEVCFQKKSEVAQFESQSEKWLEASVEELSVKVAYI